MTKLAQALYEAWKEQKIASEEFTGLSQEENDKGQVKNGYFIVEALAETGLELEAHQHGIAGTTLVVFPKQPSC